MSTNVITDWWTPSSAEARKRHAELMDAIRSELGTSAEWRPSASLCAALREKGLTFHGVAFNAAARELAHQGVIERRGEKAQRRYRARPQGEASVEAAVDEGPQLGIVAARFWSRVSVGRRDECWEWRGSRDGKQYGTFTVGSAPWGSHRLAWVLVHGSIPDGLHVLHRCDNPPCVNPHHLFLGTHLENMQDMVRKGRHKWRLRERKNFDPSTGAFAPGTGGQ